jgi:hypothetical protein
MQQTWKNAAEQSITSNRYVRSTLEKMNSNLKTAFNEASKPDAPLADKENFVQLAFEINQDVGKLSPAFEIVAGGNCGFDTDKYEFVMTERSLAAGKKEFVTLTQAIQEIVQPSTPPETAVQERQEIEAHLASLIKPSALDRKPFRPPS